MTQEQIENLHKLSREEKLEVVQMLWDDLATDSSKISLPAQHKKILDDRIDDLKSGKTSFKAWELIREKYLPGK